MLIWCHNCQYMIPMRKVLYLPDLAVSYNSVIIESENMDKVKRIKELEDELNQLKSKPTIYGYARVSTKGQARDGNSIEAQTQELMGNNAEIIFVDTYTGCKMERPEFDKLLKTLKEGDTIVVTKLDRFARSAAQGIELVSSLLDHGIKVHILNMGLLDNSPTGKLIRNVMLCFAEFERDMIVQRTTEGKNIARKNVDYREGRKPVYCKEQIMHALELLSKYSYSQVAKMTGISKSTLIRARKRIIEI